MKLAIIGLTNTGRTTLFNALTRAGIETSSHMFSTVKPNIGAVAVPDERLARLAEIFKPKKTTPAYIEFVDVAGLVKGAARGEGMGNSFLLQIREVDALLHVVRCFEDENIPHVDNSIDPLRDLETINLELIVADLESVEKRIDSVEKHSRVVKDAKTAQELEILKKVRDSLEKEIPARNAGLSDEELKAIRSFGLLTLKPVVICANISEEDINKEPDELAAVKKIKERASKDGSEVIVICAKVEEEIAMLENEDKEIFMQELGIKQSGLDQLVTASYRVLGLISFLTAGPDEVRAWTIKKGDKAPKAAGKIHSDIERGFIRAETIPYSTFMELGGSMVKAKEKGLLRSEGKEYVVNDGDIIDFRFNV